MFGSLLQGFQVALDPANIQWLLLGPPLGWWSGICLPSAARWALL